MVYQIFLDEELAELGDESKLKTMKTMISIHLNI